MKGKSRYRMRGVLLAWVLLALPCEAFAGFQWLDFWKSQSHGIYGFRYGPDLPNGFGPSLGMTETNESHQFSDLYVSRTFSLTSSLPYGSEIDLDFSAYLSESEPENARFNWLTIIGFVDMATQHDFWRAYARPFVHESVWLPDGIYKFYVRMQLSFFGPFDTTIDPHVRTEYVTSFRSTNVPEPKAWFAMFQGLACVAGIGFSSKRRRRKRT